MSDFLRKPLTGLLLVAGAAGGPYVLFETDAGRQAGQQLLGQSAADPDPNASGMGSSSNGGAMLLNPGPHEHSLDQPVMHSLRDVLRFDISPGWVFTHFPRVSTVLADTHLDGLRVPLITGTTPSDIAGTLTYQFDRYKRLQRVTVHGSTGDATRFVTELQQLYRLQQVPSLGGSLYVLQWNGQPTSLVYLEPAPVIYGDAPYARFNVLIELNQAGLEYGLSREARSLIDAGKSTSRW